MDTAPIVAAVTALGTLGAGIKFVWNKVDARFAKIEEELHSCEDLRQKGQEHWRKQELLNAERRGLMATIIELLTGEVRQLKPDSHVLPRIERLQSEYAAKISDMDRAP